MVVDLAEAAALGYFRNIYFPDPSVFSRSSLNAFIALGRPYWRAGRNRTAQLLLHRRRVIERQAGAVLAPAKNGGSDDFDTHREHATNVGQVFRDPTNT